MIFLYFYTMQNCIGRIFTKNKSLKVLELFEKTDDKEVLTDNSVPLLIVGKKLVQSLFPKEKIHILDKKIGNNVYWTYSLAEKRDEFEKDLEKFYETAIYNVSEAFTYTNVNILLLSLSRIKSMISFLMNGKKKIFYFSNNHVYIYYGEHKIIGFSLNDTNYIGIKTEKIVSLLKRNKNNTIITSDSFIPWKIKGKITDKTMLIPYLYAIFSEN